VLGIFGCRRAAAPAVPAISKSDDPQIAAAIEQAKSRVIAEPQSGPAWGQLGATLMAHKFHKEAMECFAQAEKFQPTEPRWPYCQGVMLLWWDANAAVPKLERAAELTGNTPLAPRLRLADALLERGQLEQAEKHLQSLAKQHPAEPYVLLGLGRSALAAERLDEALNYLAQSATNAQTARASVALIAGILHRMGKTKAAAEASSHLATLPPDPAMIDPYLGELGDLQTGMQAWLDRAERLFKANKSRDALALLEKTVATYPAAAAPWRMLGQAQMRQRDPVAAEKSLRKAAELAPSESATYYQLGNLFGAQNRFGEAAECFQKDARSSAERRVRILPFGPVFHTRGEQQKERSRHIALRLSTIRRLPLPTRNSAIFFGERGRYDEAFEVLARAVKLDPGDARAARNLERARGLRKEKP
jgi:tetratricopeptide (TPR) repeat protein